MEERRDAVISSLVKYLGPEASTYIHYGEKVCGEFQPICSLSHREFIVIVLQNPPLQLYSVFF